jgi:hypothetical protein
VRIQSTASPSGPGLEHPEPAGRGPLTPRQLRAWRTLQAAHDRCLTLERAATTRPGTVTAALAEWTRALRAVDRVGLREVPLNDALPSERPRVIWLFPQAWRPAPPEPTLRQVLLRDIHARYQRAASRGERCGSASSTASSRAAI